MTTKVELAMKALELQGMGSSMKRLFESTLEALSKIPTISAAELRIIRRRGEERMSSLLFDLSVAAANVLSEEEMRAIITFYEGPLGQSIRAKLPLLESAGKMLGLQWCEGLMEDLPEG